MVYGIDGGQLFEKLGTGTWVEEMEVGGRAMTAPWDVWTGTASDRE